MSRNLERRQVRAGHSYSAEHMSDSHVIWAVVVNFALTVVQIVSGILSGSLALIPRRSAPPAGQWSPKPATNSGTFVPAASNFIGTKMPLSTFLRSALPRMRPQRVTGWARLCPTPAHRLRVHPETQRHQQPSCPTCPYPDLRVSTRKSE